MLERSTVTQLITRQSNSPPSKNFWIYNNLNLLISKFRKSSKHKRRKKKSIANDSTFQLNNTKHGLRKNLLLLLFFNKKKQKLISKGSKTDKFHKIKPSLECAKELKFIH